MWSDSETEIDFVGFKSHADLIKAVVTDPTLLPVTIGLFGDWGSGKSSVLKMLAHDLDPQNQNDAEKQALEGVACLYFNGWLFAGYDDAKSALLSTLIQELAEHEHFGKKIKDRAKELLRKVDWMRAAKLGLTKVVLPAAIAHATGGVSILAALGAAGVKLIDPSHHEEGDKKEAEKKTESKEEKSPFKDLIRENAEAADPQDVRSFRKSFQELLNQSDIKTLVVLIDDLDRCSPERIVENLEAIKLFLNVDRTAFVIGADPRIVRHAVSKHYRDADTGQSANDKAQQEQLVRDYLEKVIQIPYHLPPLSPSETLTYMTLLFCARTIRDDGVRANLVSACEEQRVRDRYTAFGKEEVLTVVRREGGQVPEGLEPDLSLAALAAPLINEGLNGNPRQIKRFLNAFTLRKRHAEVAGLKEHIRDDVLVKLMILEYVHPTEFKELYSWQASEAGRPAAFASDETAVRTGQPPISLPENWRIPDMVKWLSLEPGLGEHDLRDYFWLARDRMASTLSNMTMVSPVVRSLAKSLMSAVVTEREGAATQARQLNHVDRPALHSMLEATLVGDPSKEPPYEAFHALIDSQVEGAAGAFARALGSANAGNLLPGEAFRLTLLLEAKGDLQPIFAQTLERIRNAGGPFAAALPHSPQQA